MLSFENLKSANALWHGRPATLKECTEQLLEFLIKLKAHNTDLFGVWYEKGWSRKQALQNKVEFSYTGIKRLFSKRIKNDELYPETSYIGGAWNGGPEGETCSFMACLGGGGFRQYPNSFGLDLPFSGFYREYYQAPAHQQALINLLVEYWKPDLLTIRPWKGDLVEIECKN